MTIRLIEQRAFSVSVGHIADAVLAVLEIPRTEDVLLIFNGLVVTISPEDDEAAVIVKYLKAGSDASTGPSTDRPLPRRIDNDTRQAYIARLAERMRSDAATGMPTSQMNRTNFASLAVSAVLEIDRELSFFPG